MHRRYAHPERMLDTNTLSSAAGAILRNASALAVSGTVHGGPSTSLLSPQFPVEAWHTVERYGSVVGTCVQWQRCAGMRVFFTSRLTCSRRARSYVLAAGGVAIRGAMDASASVMYWFASVFVFFNMLAILLSSGT